MFKKLLLSLSIVTAVGAAGIMGTQALLSDDAVLGNSTFSTGTVNLKISNGNGYQEGPVTGFTGTLNPGQNKDYTVYLQNATTDEALSLAGKILSGSASEGVSESQVTITFTEVDVNGNEFAGGASFDGSLVGWKSGAAFPAEFNLSANAEQRYKMNVALASTATSGSFNFDFQFTGTQIVPNPAP